ncbi:helix-turn-helix domain-containing protein [Bacillus cereus group sp. BfR-BA-01380]|uniref:MerR family transcriptional regulator n=1 Tax=Bacillus cereus group sp. BfR-BA-01380 TaxID=2920324 RepID=UPI001F582D1C|nr:helix-turn-helix domain-containing protein [Bacillus cereus group sp. BfR-BA-01380]
MGRMIIIKEAAELFGVDKQTVRSWSNKGPLETIITPNGHRLYDIDAIDAFLGIQTNTEKLINKQVFIYACVSTKKQVENAEEKK